MRGYDSSHLDCNRNGWAWFRMPLPAIVVVAASCTLRLRDNIFVGRISGRP